MFKNNLWPVYRRAFAIVAPLLFIWVLFSVSHGGKTTQNVRPVTVIRYDTLDEAHEDLAKRFGISVDELKQSRRTHWVVPFPDSEDSKEESGNLD